MKILSDYYLCQRCNQIEPKNNWTRPYLTLVCSHCFGTEKEIWPSSEIINLFEHAKNYEKGIIHYSLVTSVFISTALELLLERLIIVISQQDFMYFEVEFFIDLLFESYQGRSRRLQLFNRLAEKPFNEEAKDTGNKNFINHWNNISELRNKLIHGTTNNQYKVTPKQIEIIINESLDVFYKIHNKYNKKSFKYKYFSINNKATINPPSDNDIYKLKKWLKGAN